MISALGLRLHDKLTHPSFMPEERDDFGNSTATDTEYVQSYVLGALIAMVDDNVEGERRSPQPTLVLS